MTSATTSTFTPVKMTYHLMLPSLAVIIVYAIVLGRPLSSRIDNLQSQLGKAPVPGTGDDPAQALTAAKTMERELGTQLTQLQANNQRLTSQSVATSQSVVTRVAELMTVFARCGVRCVESSEDSDAQHSDKQPDTANQAVHVRLRLSGSFEQMRQVLSEMQAAPAGISIRSLTMEPCLSAEDGTHQWILIISV